MDTRWTMALAIGSAVALHAQGVYAPSGVLGWAGLLVLCHWGAQVAMVPTVVDAFDRGGLAAYARAMEVAQWGWVAACVAGGVLFGWAGLGLAAASGLLYSLGAGVSMRLAGRAEAYRDQWEASLGR